MIFNGHNFVFIDKINWSNWTDWYKNENKVLKTDLDLDKTQILLF